MAIGSTIILVVSLGKIILFSMRVRRVYILCNEIQYLLGLLFPALQYNVMNISECAMSKENTPIFSCVTQERSPNPLKLNDTLNSIPHWEIMYNWFMDGDAVDGKKGMNLTMQNAMCENHRERHKIEENILGSWRCLDIIQHSEDALNHTCIRPGRIIISNFAC